MKTPLLLLCVTVPLLQSSLANEKPAPARKPNVVILLTDDQGTLDVHCYGSTDLRTPHMDRIAATGVRFTQAYAHAVCCPARAALFTGRHPQRSGVVNWTQGDRHGSDAKNTRMAAAEITLAEVMKEAGYQTALLGKWHLGASIGHGPLDQGFSTHFGHLGGFIDNYRHHFLHGRGYHDLWEGNQEIFRAGDYYPDLLTDRALQFIDTHKDHPFFMTVAFNLPHYPEQPSATFKDAYAHLPMPRRSYARVISTVDEHIGKILKKLEDNNLRHDTIVIFMSDNGHSVEDNAGISVDQHTSGYPKGHYYLAHGGGGNTGKWKGHKGTFWEGGIRVPAMISYPAQLPQGEVRDQIVTIMDWFPTVLELCGIEQNKPSPPLDGRSMTGIIRDAGAASAHQVLHFAWAQQWCVRKGDWKLIQQHNRASGKNEITLHNLAEPQPEEKNHAAGQPHILMELQSLHDQWQAETSAAQAPPR